MILSVQLSISGKTFSFNVVVGLEQGLCRNTICCLEALLVYRLYFCNRMISSLKLADKVTVV